MPQTQLMVLLHEAIAKNGNDLEHLVGRLANVTSADGQDATTEQVVAIGFLACGKALRESSLMQEVAIREQIQQINDLGADLLEAISRTESMVADNRRLLGTRRTPSRLEDETSRTTTA